MNMFANFFMQVCLIVAPLSTFTKACPQSWTETPVVQKQPHNDYMFIENCSRDKLHVAELKLSYIVLVLL